MPSSVRWRRTTEVVSYFVTIKRRATLPFFLYGDISPCRAKTASGGPLFPLAGKVGKRASRNQRFLHLLARYTICRSKLPTARSQKIPHFASSSNRLCISAAAAEWCSKELLAYTVPFCRGRRPRRPAPFYKNAPATRWAVGDAGPYGFRSVQYPHAFSFSSRFFSRGFTQWP